MPALDQKSISIQDHSSNEKENKNDMTPILNEMGCNDLNGSPFFTDQNMTNKSHVTEDQQMLPSPFSADNPFPRKSASVHP